MLSTSIKTIGRCFHPRKSYEYTNLSQKRFICRVIFVKGLSVDFQPDEIQKYFGVFGKLEIAQLFDPGVTQKSRTLLLQFEELDSAIACFNELDHAVVDSRRVFLEYSSYGPNTDEIKEMVAKRMYYRPFGTPKVEMKLNSKKPKYETPYSGKR